MQYSDAENIFFRMGKALIVSRVLESGSRINFLNRLSIDLKMKPLEYISLSIFFILHKVNSFQTALVNFNLFLQEKCIF